MFLFNHQVHIFMVTIEEIPAGVELLHNYGERYGHLPNCVQGCIKCSNEVGFIDLS